MKMVVKTIFKTGSLLLLERLRLYDLSGKIAIITYEGKNQAGPWEPA
jgi:hypothetical protein